MKRKFNLYVAIPGTYDADLTTLHLTPMELYEENFNKNLRAIKRELKYSHVVVEASEFILQNLKLDFIFVTPKVNRNNIWFYRDKFILPPFTRYVYPIIVSKLNGISNKHKIGKIELVKEMVLDEFIEGIDYSVN